MNFIKPTDDQLVLIPGGEIVLRDDRIKKTWKVELKPFLMSRYPVTQDLYFEVTNESPSAFKGNRKPVETVSWKEAVFFCNSLSAMAGLSSCYTMTDHNSIYSTLGWLPSSSRNISSMIGTLCLSIYEK